MRLIDFSSRYSNFSSVDTGCTRGGKFFFRVITKINVTEFLFFWVDLLCAIMRLNYEALVISIKKQSWSKKYSEKNVFSIM